MLTIRGLDFIRNRKEILRDVTLEVNDGEIVGIIGGPGSGKTVLLNILTGTITDFEGEVSVRSAPLASYSRAERNRMIASLAPDAPRGRGEILRDFLLLARMPHKKIFSPFSEYDLQLAGEYLSAFGLGEYRDAQIYLLPESVLKRAMLAFAFIREAYILLLDNPASLLDLKSVFLLKTAVSRYVFNGSRMVIFASNDINFALQTADRVVILERGRIAAAGAPDMVDQAMVKKYFGIEAMVSRNIYNGRPEIHFFPGG